MTTIDEMREANIRATTPPSDGSAARKEAAAQEAKARREFQDQFFGTKRREEWGKKQELWQEHKRLIDADWKNFNYWRVTYPTSIWATDPVTGQDRQPGEIDRAEILLEDINIRAYMAVHGPGAPSGLPAGTKIGEFIVSDEEAKLLLERYGQEFDMQAARVRLLKAEALERAERALDPWRWNGGKVDQELIDRIEQAGTVIPGRSALYGTDKPAMHGVIGEGVDELISRAIRYDRGAGSDRSLAYALVLQFKDAPLFKPRMLMLGRELEDEAIYELFRHQALYGPWAAEKREIVKLTPRHVPEFLRYGTQEQLEANLREQLGENEA